jgi:hypothetical protein
VLRLPLPLLARTKDSRSYEGDNVKKKLFAMTPGGEGHKPRGKNYTITWGVFEVLADKTLIPVRQESGFPNANQAKQRAELLTKLSTHQYVSQQE